MKCHPPVVESQVAQEKGSGETCWKKSRWTWLAENVAPFLLPLIWHCSYVGLTARKPDQS